MTVVAHRVPRGESIVGPRSRCPACGAQIAAYDNVPVFSWLVLRGRARCCGAAISPRYPLAELALGALYAAIVLVLWDDPGEIALGLVFVTMLVAVTLTDLERRVIPNKILIVAAVLGIAIAAAADPASLPERAIAAAAAGGLLFARRARLPARDGARRRQAGGGDGSLPRPRRRPGDPRRAAGRLDRRPGDDRPPRRRRPQAGDPLRAVPRPRRRRRTARRRRVGRPVPGHSSPRAQIRPRN